MSSIADSGVSGFNFTGGFPTSKDLAPSIVFIIAFIIVLPVLVWRLARFQDRTVVLLRPAVFIVIRIASLILRAVMSKTNYGEGELIAELVLVSVGYLFLIEPLIALWNRHIATAVRKSQRPGWVRRLALFLRLGLLACIGTAIAGSALISGAVGNPSKESTVKQVRDASSIMAIVVIVVTTNAIILTHIRLGLDARHTLYLLAIAVPLIIISVYRTIQIFTANPSAAVRSKPAFWILQVLFEFIAFCLYVSISIPTWFPKELSDKEERELETKRGPGAVQSGQAV